MRNIFSAYILPAILIGFIGVLGFGIVTKTQKHNELYGDINALDEELTRIEEENSKLKAQIESFKNPETIDREARQRLNLKKEDEHVVVILPPDEETIEEVTEEKTPQKEDLSFWQKIVNIFK
ncbi:MAG: septum formation initiator family protein [Candidatus Spechtbacterales bacterium]|nr:septum formation initiator family protein [Candidatus Spechtbacterales bacterium]